MAPKYALLSVSDKTDLPAFGKALADAGYTILSTGGTARVLAEAGVAVTKVSDHTGAPEIFNGRVTTLHPRIHGGILGDRGVHAEEADAQDIPWIDVVAVNLYPFEKVTNQGADIATAIEGNAGRDMAHAQHQVHLPAGGEIEADLEIRLADTAKEVGPVSQRGSVVESKGNHLLD